MTALFDMKLRAMRRDRAANAGVEPFLFDRLFEDCLDRLSLVGRHFERALLIGCPDPGWPARLHTAADVIEVRDPGARFAAGAGGLVVVEDVDPLAPASYDLVLALGTLDTVNDLPRALRSIRGCLRSGGLLLGAMAGGDTLPQLRAAMRALDRARGGAAAYVHPRIEASAVAPLLEAAGFTAPVVDVDRVTVTYPDIGRLVSDLRRMGATNILSARPTIPLTRNEFALAAKHFAQAGDGGRTAETFEFLHFAGWAR